jgi:hypothetical protein
MGRYYNDTLEKAHCWGGKPEKPNDGSVIIINNSQGSNHPLNGRQDVVSMSYRMLFFVNFENETNF